jgi:hypothetical protein
VLPDHMLLFSHAYTWMACHDDGAMVPTMPKSIKPTLQSTSSTIMLEFEAQANVAPWHIPARSPAIVHDQQVPGMQVRMESGAAHIDHGPKPNIKRTA